MLLPRAREHVGVVAIVVVVVVVVAVAVVVSLFLLLFLLVLLLLLLLSFVVVVVVVPDGDGFGCATGCCGARPLRSLFSPVLSEWFSHGETTTPHPRSLPQTRKPNYCK